MSLGDRVGELYERTNGRFKRRNEDKVQDGDCGCRS